MGKKLKKETKAESDEVFEPLTVESREAQTVVIMLTSPEDTVQAKACESIYKYVAKTDENRKTLFDLGACDHLLKLLTSQDRVVRRNAMMAISVMAAHTEVRNYLRKQGTIIALAIKLLGPEDTTTTHEFSGLLLSYMALDYSTKVAIAQAEGLAPLVACLAESDPDVQKNALETIALLLQDSATRAAIRASSSAGIEPVLGLTQSEYPVIQQLALTALTLIAQEPENRAILRDLNALERFVEIIGSPLLNDQHVNALHALSICLEDPDCIQRMKENKGMVRLIAFITDVKPDEGDEGGKGGGGEAKKGKGKKGGSAKKKVATDKASKTKGAESEEDEDKVASHTLPEAKIHACHAIGRCARTEANRKLLHECEAERMLITLLAHEDDAVKAAAAQGLAVMAESSLIRNAIGELGGIEPLVKCAATRSDKSDLKESALAALVNLTTGSSTNCKMLVSAHGVETLVQCLAQGSADEEREYVAAHAATILINLATEEPFRNAVLRANIVRESLKPLVSGSPMVQSRGALLVSSYINENDLRNEFRNLGGLERLVNLLKSYTEEVRRNSSWALSIVIGDEQAAKTVCALGGLQILHDQVASESRRSRFTELALTKLLDHHLSAKFAYTSRLERTDLIADGFFDLGTPLRVGTPMPAIDELLRAEINNNKPVLLINPKPEPPKTNPVSKPPASIAGESEGGRSSSAKSSHSGIEITAKPSKAGDAQDGGEGDATGRTEQAPAQQLQPQAGGQPGTSAGRRPGGADQGSDGLELPMDPRLYRYLEETSKIPLLVSLREQVITLARYVADKMGGPVEPARVVGFSHELHIAQLRVQLKSNVIPLGLIQAGTYIHRSLLFKVLADRISLPSTLVRSEYNRAWNEVWLVDEGRTISARNPARKYIVDLMHDPGRLLLDSSPEALQYIRI